MKKVVAGICLGASLLFAQNQYFMGIGLGHGSWDLDTKATISGVGSVASSDSDSRRLMSILGGAIIDNKHKISGEYAVYNTDDDMDMYHIAVGYGYYLNYFKNSKYKPYIGGNFTVIKCEETVKNGGGLTWDKNKYDATFKSIMLNFGLDYEIDKKQFIGFNYAYELSTSGDISVSGTYNGNRFYVTAEPKNLNRWLVTYNYKF